MSDKSKLSSILNQISVEKCTLSSGDVIEAKSASSKTINDLVKLIFERDSQTILPKFESTISQLLKETFGESVQDVRYIDRNKLILFARLVSVGDNYIIRDLQEPDNNEKVVLEDIRDDINTTQLEYQSDTLDIDIDPDNNISVKIVLDTNKTIGDIDKLNKKFYNVILKKAKDIDIVMRQQSLEMLKILKSVTINTDDDEYTIHFDQLNVGDAYEALSQLPIKITTKVIGVIESISKQEIDGFLDRGDYTVEINPLFFSDR